MSGLIISGMHHSGTSVVAGLLANSGWHPGDHLIPKDARLDKEFWEDDEFVSINRKMLALPETYSEIPNDWGLHGSDPLQIKPDKNSIQLAKLYCEKRSAGDANWIAKDPRSSLTIPIWAEIPNLKFLFVYRNPWDVVESLMRFGAPFSGRADWALGAWRAYNSTLLEMCEALGSRCAVVSSATILHDPSKFIETVSLWTGTETTNSKPQEVINPNLFKDREEGTHISSVFRTLNPDESEILDRLDSKALIPRRRVRNIPRRIHPGNGAGTKEAIQVVLACRNDGQYLAESIASVEEAASQVEFPIELTIVDSASDDDSTKRYFTRLSDAGYQVVRTEVAGLPAARNRGLKMSNSNIVLHLDADNRIRVKAFMYAEFIFNNSADIVYGKWQHFGLETQTIVPPREITWDALVPDNTIDSCTLISRSTLTQLGRWDESLTLGLEDWDLWLRALSDNTRFKFVDEVFFDYFARPDSMTWKLVHNPSLGDAAYLAIVKKHLEVAKASGANTSHWEFLAATKSRRLILKIRGLQRLENLVRSRLRK